MTFKEQTLQLSWSITVSVSICFRAFSEYTSFYSILFQTVHRFDHHDGLLRILTFLCLRGLQLFEVCLYFSLTGKAEIGCWFWNAHVKMKLVPQL